jgi:outer membrane protein TolC
MRWKKWIGGLALLLAMGCQQKVFMTKPDFEESKLLGITGMINVSNAVEKPSTEIFPHPAVCSSPERKMRYISLAESIAIALEQGTVGNTQNPLAIAGAQELVPDQLGVFSPSVGQVFQVRFNGSTDAIKVLRLDPAITGAGIESSLSKFDAVWSSSAAWNTTDQPIGTSLQTFEAAGQTSAIQQQQATMSTGIIKPLSTGGVASLTFDTVYTNTNLPSRINPAYQPTLQFGFEQPLMQGFGTEIEELRPNSPGSILHPGTFNTQPTAEGILLTRLRYDQQRVNFELQVSYMLLNVELAYWNLYNGYWNLYTQETGLRLAYEAWRIFNARYQAGKVNIADLAQTRGQYELFRSQRLSAVNQVLEYERELRLLLGLPAEDGERLVPADQPTLASYTPDWSSSVHQALVNKPELIMARQEVKAAQMNLRVAEDMELPDVRLTATYDFNDIGSRLDGPGSDNAFRNLSTGRFSDWSVGIQGNIPIGFRDAHAKTRLAKLQLSRAFAVVQDQEIKLQSFMGEMYRLLDFQYEQIKVNRAQREAYGQQIRALSEQIKVGSQTPDILLEAQRFFATALQAEYQAITNYNQLLVGWEFYKGTIMLHDNIVISDGLMPGAVQVRAVEHERERTAALVVREHPIAKDPMHCDSDTGVLPQIPTGTAVSLPALLSDQQPLPPQPQMPAAKSSTPALPPVGNTLSQQPQTPAAKPSNPALPPVGNTLSPLGGSQTGTSSNPALPPVGNTPPTPGMLPPVGKPSTQPTSTLGPISGMTPSSTPPAPSGGGM